MVTTWSIGETKPFLVLLRVKRSSNLKACEVYNGRFAPRLFLDSSACCLCVNDRKYRDLKIKYETSMNSSSSATLEGKFIPVRNGARPSPNPKNALCYPIQPVPNPQWNNRRTRNQTHRRLNYRRPADWILRPGKRQCMCFPGARINDMIAARDDVMTGSDDNNLFILHTGTNDVKANRSEELMEKYNRLIQDTRKSQSS